MGGKLWLRFKESFFQIVTINNNWGVIEDTLLPFLLRSVAISMDLHPHDDTTIIRWSRHVVSSDIESTVLPISISCHILSSLLDAAMHADQAVRSTLGGSSVGEYCTEKLFGALLSDLCDMTIRMILNSSEHRSCAVNLLFPTILDAFASKDSFEIPAHGETCNISRNYFFMKTWECCRSLFSNGPVERRDAYGIISLYLSYLPCVDGSEVEVVHRAEEFTIITENEFWDEIKRGLRKHGSVSVLAKFYTKLITFDSIEAFLTDPHNLGIIRGNILIVTAEKWIPIIKVPANSVKTFLEKKKREGFSVLGLEQTANSVPQDKFEFPKRIVLVLGREKEGMPSLLWMLALRCHSFVRSLNVHVSSVPVPFLFGSILGNRDPNNNHILVEQDF